MSKFHKELARLHSILRSKGWQIRYSRHALDEMQIDHIYHADVMEVLTKGHVTWFEVKKDDIIHVEGRDLDGRNIRLIVGLRDAVITLKIVTAFELK